MGSGGSLVTFINNIANMLTGPLGQGLAILALAVVFIGMMFNAFDIRRGGMVVFGIAGLFSAAWIAAQITGGSGG